jgi:very-short-patch-repair endonuclease
VHAAPRLVQEPRIRPRPAPPHDGAEQQDHDIRRDAWLRSQGYRILHIPNGIVIGGGDIVLDRIRAVVRPPPSSDPR